MPKLSHEDAVDGFMLNLQHAKYHEYRPPHIRASGMPFCPLLYTLNTGHGETEYSSQYYFRTGTAIHELIQTAGHRNEFGRGLLWGDWKCSHCIRKAGDPKKVAVGHAGCLKPTVICETCRSNTPDWEYEEVTIEYNGISGHIDTILCIKWHKNPRKRKYIIVDYKTTGTMFNGHLNHGKYPYRGNVIQISLYCFVMKEKYGLNITGFSLVYVDRAKPVRSIKDYVPVHQKWTDENHKNMGKKLDWIAKRGPNAVAIWNSLYNKGKMPEKKHLEDIVENRPCKSEENWTAWMAAMFEREQAKADRVCEHLGACSGTSKKVYAHFEKLYKEVLNA